MANIYCIKYKKSTKNKDPEISFISSTRLLLSATFVPWENAKDKLKGTDLKISFYVRLYIKIVPLKFHILLKILCLFTYKVCKMFVYEHAETIEYVKK